jgi:hypothetical protein
MDKFWELMRESVIVQGLITLTFVLTVCYLWVVGRTIPGELLSVLGLVLGYYFGAKSQLALANTIRSLQTGDRRQK